MMRCPVCGEKTRVVDNVTTPTDVLRKRKCEACGFAFRTLEFELTGENVDIRKEWIKYHR